MAIFEISMINTVTYEKEDIAQFDTETLDVPIIESIISNISPLVNEKPQIDINTYDYVQVSQRKIKDSRLQTHKDDPQTTWEIIMRIPTYMFRENDTIR